MCTADRLVRETRLSQTDRSSTAVARRYDKYYKYLLTLMDRATLPHAPSTVVLYKELDAEVTSCVDVESTWPRPPSSPGVRLFA